METIWRSFMNPEPNELLLRRVDTYFELKVHRIAPMLHYESPEFSFLGTACTFCLRGCYETRRLSVYLRGLEKIAKPVTCTYGLKKPDGTLVEKRTFRQDSFECRIYTCLLKNFMDHKSEFFPSDTLTVTCRLQHDPDQMKKQPSKLVELETLSSDFGSLFEDKIKCDVTLRVGDKEFQAHRAVLMARSKVLRAMFLHNTSEQETGVVNIPDCDSDSFGIFLRYLYTGRMEGVFAKDASHLYSVADKYDVPRLRSFCVDMMARNLSLENICSVAALADLHGEADLMSEAQTFFNENYAKIKRTDEWMELKKENCQLVNELLEEMLDSLTE